MAGSRIHKIGSIFERISGLLETGVISPTDKPIWYDVYKLHPPKYNPVFDRPPLNIEIKPVLYEEDVIRAKIHGRKNDVHDLNDDYKKRKTFLCQELMKSGESLHTAIEKVSKIEDSAPAPEKSKQFSTIFEDMQGLKDEEYNK